MPSDMPYNFVGCTHRLVVREHMGRESDVGRPPDGDT